MLKYARYARGGRFSDPSSISKLLDYTPTVRPPKDVLTDIAASAAPDAYLRSLHPQHEQFEGLRRLLLKLARARRRGDRLRREGTDRSASIRPFRDTGAGRDCKRGSWARKCR